MTTSIDWAVVGIKVAAYIYSLNQWNNSPEIEITGKTCKVQAKGRVHELKWVWDSQCECEGIVGEPRHFNSQECYSGLYSQSWASWFING